MHRASSTPFRCDFRCRAMDGWNGHSDAPLHPLTLDLFAAAIAAREFERRE